MSWNEQVAAMEELAADSELLRTHQPLGADDDATCTSDGEEYSCGLVAALVERYATPEGPEAGRAKDPDDLIERFARETA